ncbi:uncharacterized protein METZ01_LOCUS466668, partial [marine metagenome]
GSGHTYGFKLTPTSDPASITVSIPTGAAIGEGNASVAGSGTIDFRYAPETRSTALLGWWKLDEGSGNTAVNSGSAGIAKNAALLDGATFVAGGRFGGALQISPGNANSRLEVAGLGLDIGAESTLTAWFKELYPLGTWRTLFRGNGGDHQVIIQDSTNYLGVFDNANNGNFRDSGADLVAGNYATDWHHVSAVGSGGTTKFYVDALLVGTSDRQSTTDIWRIGNWGNQRFAKYLDDVRVYDIALSATA